MQSWTSVGSMYLSVFLLLLASCRAAGETVYIHASGSGDDQLRKALENQTVDTVVFTSDYSVGSQFDAYDGPVQDGIPMIAINRNVTFTGPPGQQQVLLDLGFVLSAVDMCDTCIFSIHDMAITNDRKGANAQLDFFMGAGNSVINLTNVLRKRLSCTPIGPALQLVERTGRDPKYPAPDGSLKQVYGADDVTFRGKVYPETLHLINYSVNFPRHYNGGYSLLLNNVYRMCDNFFDAKCLLTTEADYCALVHMNELLAEQHGGAASRRLTAGAIAGIAVAAVLGAAGVVAGCVLLVRPRLTSAVLKNSIDTSSGSGSAGITDTAVGKDLEHGLPADLKVKLEHGLAAAPTAVCAMRGPLTDMPLKGADASNGTRDSCGSNHSIIAASTAAAHHDVPTGNSIGDLRFGILLGAGSFGRVYKARWNGRDVAVKVIEHDIRMAESVANEVQLMLSCNHRNVVRAYHYMTINPCRSQTSSLVVKSTDVSSGDHAAASSSADLTFAGTIHCNGMGSKAVGKAIGPGQRHLLPVQSSGSFETVHSQDVSLQAKQHHHQHHHDQTLPLHQLQLPKLQPEVKLPLPLQQLPVPRPQFAVVEAASSEDWPPMMEQLDDSDCWDVDNSKTWLIQEYCDGGTLSKLSNSWMPATEGDAQMLKRLALLQDVVRGLAYLHGKNIVHGDLNARNVLVTSSSSAICGFTAKLADLGLSRTIKQHATHHTTCSVGTMSHMPPELLRQGRMSTAVDIYSLGVMMSELYTREVAFRGLHYGQFYETVVLQDMRPRLPPNIPDDYKLLMERCWATEPADRPSARTVLECLGLMISDRQRSLGLPETGSSMVNPGSSCSTGSHSFGGSAGATSSGFVPPWQGI